MSYERNVPPTYLYKYQPLSAQTLAALKGRTLWFGSPSKFNDPFDFNVPVKFRPLTLADCKRIINSTNDERWQQLRRDRRFVDSSGGPTAQLRELIQRTGELTFQERSKHTY